MSECSTFLETVLKVVSTSASAVTAWIAYSAFGYAKKQFQLANAKDRREVIAQEEMVVERWTKEFESNNSATSVKRADLKLREGGDLRLVHLALYKAMKNSFPGLIKFHEWQVKNVKEDQHLGRWQHPGRG